MANDNKSYDELLSAFESVPKKSAENKPDSPTGGQRNQPVQKSYRQVNYGGAKPKAPPQTGSTNRGMAPSQQKYEDVSSSSTEKKSYKNGVYFSNPPQNITKEAQVQRTGKRVGAPRVPQPVAKKPKPQKKQTFFEKWGKGLLIKLAIIIGVSAILCIYGIGCINDVLALDVEDVSKEVRVEQGMTDSEVINILKDEDLIHNKLFCKVFIKFMNLTDDSSKKKTYISGVYTLSPQYGVEKMLSTMKTDYRNSETVKLTFPEGWTITEIAEKLEANDVCTASSFISTVQTIDFSEEYSFIKKIPDKEKRFRVLEGYMYPDTYEFYKGENASSVVRRFLDNFQNRWTDEYQKKADKRGLSIDEVIIMASILEAEAANAEQMPKIAAVLYNRLDKSGTFPLLQCDSTEDYLLDVIKPQLTSSIEDTQKYLQYRDDYDTYSENCEGLPIGAIGNPGNAAIKAALDPADTNYYYFRHDVNGGIYYANTMAQHEENGRIAAKVKKDD